MSASDPFFRGENVSLRVYQQVGSAIKPIYIAAKNWEVEEDAAEIADGVNGEIRDRLDKVTNFYRGSVDIFQSDQEVMDAIMAAQTEDDANNFPLKQTLAVMIQHAGGVSACYLCQEAKLGPWKKTLSSRQEAVMLGLKFRFRFYKKVRVYLVLFQYHLKGDGPRFSRRCVKVRELDDAETSDNLKQAALSIGDTGTVLDLRRAEFRGGLRYFIKEISEPTDDPMKSDLKWKKVDHSTFDEGLSKWFTAKDLQVIEALWVEFHNVTAKEVEAITGKAVPLSEG